MTGENQPSTQALAELLTIFNRKNQVALLIAFLTDQVPESLRNLLDISPRTAAARVAEETAIYRSRMPRALREAYDWLGADALVNEATADWIIANHERLSGAGVKPLPRKESAA